MTPPATSVPVSDAPPKERREAGRATRESAPRSTLGEWSPPARRPDPVAVLEGEAKNRLPELIPLRHSRMLASAFTFYRGGAGIMAGDLSEAPVTGLRAQLCGDAHLSNFGGYAAPDRSLVFDVNDFDETLPGPWEWDVARLAASFEIAARDRGFARKERRLVVATVVREYRLAMRQLAEMSNLDLWFQRLDVGKAIASSGAEIGKRGRKILDRNLAKARSKDRMRALSKLTERVGGELRIIHQPPLIVPLEDLLTPRQARGADEQIRAMLDTYRKTLSNENLHLFDSYRYVHSARKVVGVGSVGTRAWIALFVGRDDGDPMFLQIKEAGESVLEPYAGRSRVRHHGRRVVEGQRLTQAAGDIMLGWMTATGLDEVERNFYVRQLWDQKMSARVDLMEPPHLAAYAKLCGATLARAHARSGDRIAIAGYLGKGTSFEDSLVRFASAYADQNELDFSSLLEAVSDGRIATEEETA
jgi:uncharacterized protein (DUF2252 family)